jgi:hypothetical protein
MTNVHVLIAAALRERKVSFFDEKGFQSVFAELLATLGMTFVREFALCGEDRVDFYLPSSRTGIETKIYGTGRNGVLRQLKRYADHPAIAELILVCPRPWHVPATLSNKPLHLVAFFGSLV